MQIIKTKLNTILLIKLPDDVTWWEIIKNTTGDFITNTLGLNQMFLSSGKHSNIMGKLVSNVICYLPKDFYLPKGNWEIIGKFSELKNEDFEKIIKSTNTNLYKMYFWSEDKIKSMGIQPLTPFAKESFQSLCKSQGVEDDLNNYLIIKNK